MPKYAIYGILLKLCRLIQVLIYSVSMSKTNTNMNIFGLIKKGEYEYEYIRGNKKRQIRIRIWIFGLIFANMNTNTNTNIHHTLCPPHFRIQGGYPKNDGWRVEIFVSNFGWIFLTKSLVYIFTTFSHITQKIITRWYI